LDHPLSFFYIISVIHNLLSFILGIRECIRPKKTVL